jgi:hypothetical protein
MKYDVECPQCGSVLTVDVPSGRNPMPRGAVCTSEKKWKPKNIRELNEAVIEKLSGEGIDINDFGSAGSPNTTTPLVAIKNTPENKKVLQDLGIGYSKDYDALYIKGETTLKNIVNAR